MTIYLSTATKVLLTNAEKAQITAKDLICTIFGGILSTIIKLLLI